MRGRRNGTGWTIPGVKDLKRGSDNIEKNLHYDGQEKRQEKRDEHMWTMGRNKK